MRLRTRPNVIPDEHVLAASQIYGLAGKNADKIAAIRFNDVTIDKPVERAAALRAMYAVQGENDPRKRAKLWLHAVGQWLRPVSQPVGRWLRPVTRPMSRATRGAKRWLGHKAQATLHRLQPVKAAISRKLASEWPRPPRMLEAVYARAAIEVDLTDGHTFKLASEPVLSRTATLPILNVTTLANAGASVTPVWGLGAIPLSAGVIAALVKGTGALALGRLRQTGGYAAAIVKMALLGVCDCVPILSTATIYPAVFNAVKNRDALQKGEMLLINAKHFAPLLAGLAATGIPLQQTDDAHEPAGATPGAAAVAT